jgi:hypothetical protein
MYFRLITSTVRLPKPKRKELIEAENVVNRTGIIIHRFYLFEYLNYFRYSKT